MHYRYLLRLALLALPVSAYAHQDDVPIQTGSELLEWCRAESEARFVGQSKTPSNWTARHHERGNTLKVDGRWRVDGEYVVVACRIARGARREYASIKMQPE